MFFPRLHKTWFPSVLREGCGIPFVQTHSRKDEQADGRDSRQLPWAARVPKARGSSKQKGVPRSPRPGSRGAGVWNRDDGFCTRQLWTPDARRTRQGDTAEGLSSEHSRASSRPARPQKPCVTRAQPREFSHHEPLFYISAFSPSWISEPGNSMGSLAGGCSKALGNHPTGSCKL